MHTGRETGDKIKREKYKRDGKEAGKLTGKNRDREGETGGEIHREIYIQGD